MPVMPVLIPGTRGVEPDGLVLFREDMIKKGELSEGFQPVMLFTPPKELRRVLGEKGLERVWALGRLHALYQGKPIDRELADKAGKGFAALAQTVLPPWLAAQQSAQAKEEHGNVWAGTWLQPLWNEEIKSARLVLWIPMEAKFSGPLEPAIFCPDQTTAFLVHVLLKRTRVCTGCGILFTPGRSNQLYHDYLCGVRHGMARMRLRKKKKQRKGKRHGNGKK